MVSNLPTFDRPPAYTTDRGAAYCADSLELLAQIPVGSVNLVVTSPPFALLREKTYGNHKQEDYVDWLLAFAGLVRRALRDDGSFVLDLGGAYMRGIPSRSLYQWRVLLRCCDELGYHLAEEVYWHYPSKLPSPIEWVNKRKIRMKDSVNTIWWLSKTAWPKANISKVLVPYSARMHKLFENPQKFYKPKMRPSGHDIGLGFAKDNGGAIPSNLLEISNTESNGTYLSACKAMGVPQHPARFPSRIPEYFIRLLTDPGDLVIDIFSGSNTTGQVAEAEDRRWLAIDASKEYVAASAFRFMDKNSTPETTRTIYDMLRAGNTVHIPDFWAQPSFLRPADAAQ